MSQPNNVTPIAHPCISVPCDIVAGVIIKVSRGMYPDTIDVMVDTGSTGYATLPFLATNVRKFVVGDRLTATITIG